MNERTAFLMMASDVYGGPTSESLPFGEFITSLGSVEERVIGFRAEAYRLEETGKIVVAIAGTNPLSIPSLINAGGIAAHIMPSEQIMAAVAFVRAVTDQYGPATLVGHSSGGLVAQLLSAREQAKPEGADRLPIERAIAFNSPGAAPFLPSLLGSNIPTLFENIESICDSRDFVCRYFDERGEEGMGSSHIGSIEYINPVHDSEPQFGADITNPVFLPQITTDLIRYHGIEHLTFIHAQSAPVPVPVFDGLTGSLGIGVVTIEGAELVEDPSPLEEGAQEFETFQTSSPLVLDLDGDGIETQGLLAGTFFDHAGDGFAELTGWIGADDGLLVLDRNGNGAVDHGGELFGNETVLQEGGKATDGYQALAEFDENGDGRVDASDPIWSELRVWRDADGNGDSETSELHALADVGVSAIGTGATSSTVIDANGNEHRLVGTFAQSDGGEGDTADVWFRVARRHAVDGDLLPVPGDVAALPNVQGHGTVHDLHQAIVRDASGSLKLEVQQFIAEPDPARRTALLEQILFTWTGSDGVDPGSRGPHIDARRLATLEHVYGEAFVGIEGTGNPNAEVGGLLNHTFQGFAELVYAQLMVQSPLRDVWASAMYSWDASAERVRGDLTFVVTGLHDLLSADPEAGRVTLGEFARTVRGLGVEKMVDYETFRDAFAALGEDVAWTVDSGGKTPVAGTAGDDVLTGAATRDALRGGDGNDTLSGDDGDDVLYGQAGADALIGGADADLLDGGTGNDALDGRRGNDRLFGQAGDDTLLGEGGDDSLVGGDGDDSLDGGEGNDILVGGAGADTLLGRDQDDALFGGNGDDSLTGNRGADTLAGEAGNDTLAGEGGVDVLDGGAGNDFLDGGTESDTYHFGRGGGHDAIVDRDATPGNLDVIALAAGIAPDEVHATREADDLVLGIVAANDQLRVISWFSEAAPRQYEVEEVRFADGTVWDREALRQLVIVPTEGPDRLVGYSSADTLLGLGGDDTLAGGGGDDRLDGGAGNDSLRGNEGVDTLLGGDGNDVLAGDRDDDVLAGEDGNDSLEGGGGIDHLDGGAGNDELAGGDGADSLDGGAGNDSLRGDDGDDMLRGGPGLDVISGNAGDDTLYGGADDDVLSGDRDDDILVGEAGNDRLDGGPGIDAMTGGPGDDTYVVDDPADMPTESAGEGLDTVEASVNHTLRAEVENLTLTGAGPIAGTGNNLNNRLTGNAGSNVLAGAAGDDILDGGAGLDWLAGGSGNDTYVLADAGDVVLELTGEGTDLVQSALTYTLPPNVENLALTTTGPVDGTGNELNNRLTGGGGANTLDGGAGNDVLEGGEGGDTLIGGAGADTMAGGPGDDIYVVDVGDTVVEIANAGTDRIEVAATYALPANVEDLTQTGNGAIDGTGNGLNNRLMGNAGANTLAGGAGDDVLDGGPGLDRLLGGMGNDTYVIADASDAVIELAGEGTDRIQSALTYTLPANVEDLALATTAPINGTGNALNNRLTGNLGANTLTGGAGDDILNGGGGPDTLVGGAGNDTYIVSEAADVVVENANQGTDTVESAVTYTLPGSVERLILTGAESIDGTGNALSNILTGNGAANRLNGGAGIDAMAGGAGDDTYVVDHVAEAVTEAAGEGTDTIETDVTYGLPANVERLILTGSGSINATGNTLTNALTGNSKSNVLDGGAGMDAMSGAGGNDTYIVDDVRDTVIEALNAGTDTIESAVSYTLPDNVERLTLTGAAPINGTGNALNNTLTGNGGANLLDGGTGADAMAGGAGDDTYVVDRPTDTVQEAANGGLDTILASTTYVMPANVENATLTGLDAIGITGNALANVLRGNRGANLLDGRSGNDTYRFGRGAGQDTIQDIDTTPGNADTLAFEPDLDPIDLIISRQSNNLRIAVHGAADRVDVSTWYSGASNQIEVLRAGDGRQLVSTQVEQLIQAMAGYSAHSGLSWDQAVTQRSQEVESILAAHWQPAGT